MRRHAPASPFGTSFVDLLVGALALVALLWLANAGHSGERGSGEASRSAALVDFTQYGFAHVVELRIGQPGHWSCSVAISGDGSRAGWPRSVGEVDCKPEPGSPWTVDALPGGSGVDVDRGPLGLLSVRWRLDAETFRERLELSLGGIAGRAVEAAFHIAPCCSGSEPHYVRLSTVSAAGERTRYLLWHEAKELRSVLGWGPLSTGWISTWRARVAAGDVAPSLVAFERTVNHCRTFQGHRPVPALRLRFEPEGAVRVETPAPGPSLAALHEEFPARLACYAGAPSHLGRNDQLICPGVAP